MTGLTNLLFLEDSSCLKVLASSIANLGQVHSPALCKHANKSACNDS
jgi:hypothetical protein